jgi:hypothetical protein
MSDHRSHLQALLSLPGIARFPVVALRSAEYRADPLARRPMTPGPGDWAAQQ